MTFHVAIGTRTQSEEHLMENVMTVYNRVTSKLERGIGNIRSLYIKTSMGPAIQVEVINNDCKSCSLKHGTISKLSEDISRGGTLAIIDIHGIPADAMLGMRKTLRESMSIRVAKKKLMNRAWNEANLDTGILEEMYGNAVQPALVQTSKYDSFALFSELKRLKQEELPNLEMSHQKTLL